MQTRLFAFVGLLLSQAAVVVTLPLEVAPRQTTCNSVQFFLARGSNEEYPGDTVAVVNSVCGSISSSCGYTDIIYPAVLSGAYCSSVETGRAAGLNAITSYASSCPSSKIVLVGYSQGAHVVGDILGGGGGFLIICTQATSTGLDTSSAVANQIVAAALFGDPRHVANQAYNTGDGSASNGLFPRSSSQLTSLNRYSAKLRSWCHQGDPFCSLGVDASEHTNYFEEDTAAAASWIITKL